MTVTKYTLLYRVIMCQSSTIDLIVIDINKHFILFAFPSCSSGIEEECNDDLENDAKKNTACGMITDPTGILFVAHFEPCEGALLHILACDVCSLLSIVLNSHWKYIKPPVQVAKIKFIGQDISTIQIVPRSP